MSLTSLHHHQTPARQLPGLSQCHVHLMYLQPILRGHVEKLTLWSASLWKSTTNICRQYWFVWSRIAFMFNSKCVCKFVATVLCLVLSRVQRCRLPLKKTYAKIKYKNKFAKKCTPSYRVGFAEICPHETFLRTCSLCTIIHRFSQFNPVLLSLSLSLKIWSGHSFHARSPRVPFIHRRCHPHSSLRTHAKYHRPL